jgi:ribosomal protein L11 methyltransferase
MTNKLPTSNTSSSKEQWVEISIEADQHLHDALANFLIELESNGVIVDEDIPDPLSGKVKTGREGCKLISAYLKKDDHLKHKIDSLNLYLKSLTKLHFLKDPPKLKLKIICEEDWNKKWQKFFTTTRIGKHIIVKPSWELFFPEEKDIIIEIDPGMAFGTGTHATTRMCLEAIENLILYSSKPARSMLDVGIGSGILSIAAAKMGIKKIIGIDIDPIALSYANKNIDKNHVADRVDAREISLNKLKGRFDLVVANILTDILIKLRKDIYNHLNNNGILILSGILTENKSKIRKKFASEKLALLDSNKDTDWTCLVFQKRL